VIWLCSMEETLLHEIFGVSRSYRSTRTEVRRGGVIVAVEPRDNRYLCSKCRSRDVIRKGKRIRRVQTLPIGFHPVYLEIGVPRCQCNSCQHIFEIAPPFARLTRTTPKR
jgi:transposase